MILHPTIGPPFSSKTTPAAFFCEGGGKWAVLRRRTQRQQQRHCENQQQTPRIDPAEQYSVRIVLHKVNKFVLGFDRSYFSQGLPPAAGTFGSDDRHDVFLIHSGLVIRLIWTVVSIPLIQYASAGADAVFRTDLYYIMPPITFRPGLKIGLSACLYKIRKSSRPPICIN